MAQAKENNGNGTPSGAKSSASGEGRSAKPRRPYHPRRSRRPQQPKEAATPLHIYPLGGLGEVGKNMTVYTRRRGEGWSRRPKAAPTENHVYIRN